MNADHPCLPRDEGTAITELFGEAKALDPKSVSQIQQSDVLAFSLASCIFLSKQNNTTAPTSIIKIYEELQTEGREGS